MKHTYFRRTYFPSMLIYTKAFCLSLVLSLSYAGVAQSNTSKQDTLTGHQLGFSSLFKISSTGVKDKPFQFQLHPQAVGFIQSYMEKQGPGLLKMKTWAKPYFNLYDAILTQNGIPVELKYLSVIESHLSADLVSWAGAVGPWQIMPDEATRLGLKLTPNDERTDYYKSTQAAATILKELYAEFGDWLLVVAAYNGGAGRMRQVIKKKGTKDFWKLQYDLPLETRNHVKKFIATHYVFEEDGGWTTLTQSEATVKSGKSLLLKDNLQSVKVSGRFRIAIIAQYLALAEKELAAINPKFDQVVSTGKSYELKIPLDRVEIFEARKNDILQASLQSLYSIKE